MITEKIYGKNTGSRKKTETVTIEWFERDKKILRKKTSSGEEIGIRIDETLNQDDIIYEDDERIICIDIAPCDLISISVSEMKEMGLEPPPSQDMKRALEELERRVKNEKHNSE